MDGCQLSALVTRSQNTYQMLCQSKTGTTVMDWVVRRLFEKAGEKINSCKGIEPVDEYGVKNPSAAIFVSKTEETSLSYAGNKVFFTRHYKHDSYWPDVLTRDTIQKVADTCAKNDIPIWTKKCLDKFHDLRVMKKNASDFSIVVTMRDPISIAESGIYFAKGDVSNKVLNELMLSYKGCKAAVGQIALRYSLAYVLRAYGFDIQLFFYEDFRLAPKIYMYQFSRFLGLEVEDDIITQVLEETSINASKKAQEVGRASVASTYLSTSFFFFSSLFFFSSWGVYEQFSSLAALNTTSGD